MCGIVAVVNKKGRALEENLLRSAVSAIIHRGPDAQAVHINGSVGLGIARLSIVDVAGGNQPLFNEDHSLVLVYNGEIYNSPGLRQELERNGHRFSTHSDGEVILHLYETDPSGFIEKLDGMFAFALYDTKAEKLIVARDRVGIKPLVCYEDDQWLLYCSEIKGIFATGIPARELHSQAIFDFFTFGYFPGSLTAFRGIQSFPPAHICAFDLSQRSKDIREYWYPAFPTQRESNSLSITPHITRLQRIFPESVNSQTMGDVPVASYLSGGIDSTLTAVVLKEARKDTQALHTFSIQFADKDYDESAIFRETAKQCGFEPHILNMELASSRMFSDVIYSLEQPQSTPLDIPMFLLSKLVRDSGIKVVLTGEGSDEIFGGYFMFGLSQIRRLLTVPALSVLRERILKTVLRYYIANAEEQKFLGKMLLANHSALINRLGTFPAWYPVWVKQNEYKPGLFCDQFPDSLAEGSEFDQLCQKLKQRYSGIDDLNKSILLELKTRLPNYILHRTDRNSMAHSVEARVPFLSNAMIDFACRTPPLLKLFGLKEKFALRLAFKKKIPAHVLKRKKYGFDAPSRWLWEKPDDYTRSLLSPDVFRKVGIFNSNKVQQYMNELSEAYRNPSSPRTNELANVLTRVLSVHMLHDRMIP